MVDEGDAAVRTFARLAAVAAEDEGRQPAAIQKQDRLLMALQRSADCRLQLAAQRAEVLRRDFGAQIDDGHGREWPAAGAMRELQQMLAPFERGGVGRDAGGGAAQH